MVVRSLVVARVTLQVAHGMPHIGLTWLGCNRGATKKSAVKKLLYTIRL